MISTSGSKRAATRGLWPVAVAGLLLVTAAPALGATSAQQVYEAPMTGRTPSPLPNLPVPPAGDLQLSGPFTPRAVSGPGPLVAGAGAPNPIGYPCIPTGGAAPGTSPVASPPPDAEACEPVPGDGTAVRDAVTPGPGGSTPVGEVASEPGPVSAASGSDALPVTGLDLFIVLAAAATAAGVGISLRKAAAR